MKKFLSLLFLLVLGGSVHFYGLRLPASMPGGCQDVMYDFFSQYMSRAQHIDEVITIEKLLAAEVLTEADLQKVLDDPQWSQFINEAESQDSLLIVAMLKKQDPDAPHEAVQRKYRLLFEVCGL